MTEKWASRCYEHQPALVNTLIQRASTMSIMFRRVRGRAAGHVIVVNPLLVREIQPTSWGGSEIVYSDVHVTVSRDTPATVTRFLEGRLRLCDTPLCDRLSAGQYEPLCDRCRVGCTPLDEDYEKMRADLVTAV